MTYKITNLESLMDINQAQEITEIHMYRLQNRLISSHFYTKYVPKYLYKYVSHIDEIATINEQIWEIMKCTTYDLLINAEHPSWMRSFFHRNNHYIKWNKSINIDTHIKLLKIYPKYLIPLKIFQSLLSSPEILSLFPALDNAERYYFDKSRLQTYSIDPDLIFHYGS